MIKKPRQGCGVLSFSLNTYQAGLNAGLLFNIVSMRSIIP
jgi:hypothetical protein